MSPNNLCTHEFTGHFGEQIKPFRMNFGIEGDANADGPFLVIPWKTREAAAQCRGGRASHFHTFKLKALNSDLVCKKALSIAQ